ncbi:MAG: hypothetical protein MPN21_02335 [Thermoanaerobaculia bacterium]|nr:hypothetical protein [Thermoanaerobaculia bacterium]
MLVHAPVSVDNRSFPAMAASRRPAALVICFAALLWSFFSSPLAARPASDGLAGSREGTVELPREVYDRLVAAGQLPPEVPRKAPVGWAPGTAVVTVQVDGEASVAMVRAELAVQVLEDEWTMVPILPVGTAVETARAGTESETEMTLVPVDGALSWGIREAGRHRVSLTYRAEVQETARGSVVALPLPRAASVKLTGSVPGTGHDLAVIPAEGLQLSARGGRTFFETNLPSVNGALLSWRPPTSEEHAISRASYRGTLRGAAIEWLATFSVELFGDAAVTLPLLASSLTLSHLEVDGSEASILQQNGRFATVLRGRGRHEIQVGFETRIAAGDGPPRVEMQIPPVPVSRFELRLPGRKEVQLQPAAAVASRNQGGETIAVAHAGLTQHVSILWTEAVPDDVRAETRVDGGLYHAGWAEEGILQLEALVDLDVRRGETSTFKLRVPPQVQVDAVRAAGDGQGGDAPSAVADWRLGEPVADGSRDLEIFLDRKIGQRMVVAVSYGRSLPRLSVESDDGDGEVALPLLSFPGARRQRGMVALLATRDRTLQPGTDVGEANRVGENQLPAFVRQALALPVVHTFKYVDDPPRLSVRAAEPERKVGRFDAQVDTLVSLGEVTLRAVATVDVRVKSGTVSELALELPVGAQLLGLTGPSVRRHDFAEESAASGSRRLEVEFTQDMDGQFRLEASYEQILGDGEARVAVPLLGVQGAEVEQGRIAVEALSAVEVLPAAAEQLTVLDVGELPRQLVLRTTHPILHAYKYVHAESPPRLALAVTRHALESVQEAAIDEAVYSTLYTRDGLAVTRARFQVRNSREQFLELRLPDDSEIWSVLVDGRSAKPARKEDDDGSARHLIQIIHSTRGFPVELVFQTRVGPIRGLGTLRGVLPRPEILVTRSRWDVYLPHGIDYRRPTGNMEPVVTGTAVDQSQMQREVAGEATEAQSESLRLEVPLRGVHFAFEKLYANQDPRDVGFSIPYASGHGARLATVGVVVSTLLLWIGAGLAVRRHRQALALAAVGFLGLAVLVFRFQASAAPAVAITMLGILAAAGWFVWRARAARDDEAVTP